MLLQSEFLLIGSAAVALVYGLNTWWAQRQEKVEPYQRETRDSVTQDRKEHAVLHYRMELLRTENVAIERRRAEERAINQMEVYSQSESVKLKQAINAAKRGECSAAISERYELTDSDAELIVTIHGQGVRTVDKIIH